MNTEQPRVETREPLTSLHMRPSLLGWCKLLSPSAHPDTCGLFTHPPVPAAAGRPVLGSCTQGHCRPQAEGSVPQAIPQAGGTSSPPVLLTWRFYLRDPTTPSLDSVTCVSSSQSSGKPSHVPVHSITQSMRKDTDEQLDEGAHGVRSGRTPPGSSPGPPLLGLLRGASSGRRDASLTPSPAPLASWEDVGWGWRFQASVDHPPAGSNDLIPTNVLLPP